MARVSKELIKKSLLRCPCNQLQHLEHSRAKRELWLHPTVAHQSKCWLMYSISLERKKTFKRSDDSQLLFLSLLVSVAEKKKKRKKYIKTAVPIILNWPVSQMFQLVDRAKRRQQDCTAHAPHSWAATTAAGAPLTGAANPEKVIRFANKWV